MVLYADQSLNYTRVRGVLAYVSNDVAALPERYTPRPRDKYSRFSPGYYTRELPVRRRDRIRERHRQKLRFNYDSDVTDV